MHAPPDKRRHEDYFEGKFNSKCRVESDPGSSLVTEWEEMLFTEEEGGGLMKSLWKLAFALSTGPQSGVSMGSWLFPYVSIILHAPPPPPPICCHLSLPCSVHLGADVYGLPCLVSVASG